MYNVAGVNYLLIIYHSIVIFILPQIYKYHSFRISTLIIIATIILKIKTYTDIIHIRVK